VAAAKAGRRVAVLSATQVYPFAPHLAAFATAGVPADRFVDVNRILERVGLLGRLPGGGMDLARTRVLAPAFADFFLTVNDTSWRSGIVAPTLARLVGIPAPAQAVGHVIGAALALPR
jgi:hypothetical protein